MGLPIAVFIGTRPELIKCTPILETSNIYIPVFVTQQENIIDISTNYIINIHEYTTNRLTNIVMSVLNSTIFDLSWGAILVQGDTAVAYASALAAFQRKIKIIHLEAGLRTFDLENPWPEEGYRKMIDTIANIALCPSKLSAQNLVDEKFTGSIEIVGNTSIDAINKYNFTPKIGNTVVVTLHRRENWYQIKEFFEVIEKLANIHSTMTFILPIHPNPDIKKLKNIFKTVKVIEPLVHYDMCKLLAECNCIISDSGGIQEEASFLGKHIFCCRTKTERKELCDTYLTYTASPLELFELFIPQEILLQKSVVYGIGDAYLKINTYLNNII